MIALAWVVVLLIGLPILAGIIHLFIKEWETLLAITLMMIIAIAFLWAAAYLWAYY